MDKEAQFKVIVIGGGPTGLAAAHALHLLKIDFVVLESKPDLTHDTGASLVLQPASLRILHQLGLLEEARKPKASQKMARNSQTFGIVPMCFHRFTLIQAMYNKLPDNAKARYCFKIKAVDIQCTLYGVTVFCLDGSEHHGSMVLGADGVYSKTPRLMRAMAQELDTAQEWDAEEPFVAQYRCLWASSPRLSDPGKACDTQHKDKSIMYLAGVERSWVFLYEKLPASTTSSRRYTDQDAEVYAKSFAQWLITESLKVEDVIKSKMTTGMSDLHEGILDYWSYGRIVLASDYCHKFTPNAGQGFNSALQDIAYLLSGLRHILDTNTCPSEATLSQLFRHYQQVRTQEIEFEYRLSYGLTRVHAWANPAYHFFGRYVMPRQIFVELLTTVMPRQMKQARILDYIRAKEPFNGTIQWEHKLGP